MVMAPGASGILLHEAIGHGLEADFNRKGVSIFSTQMNQKVAPDFVTVVDDGTMESTRGAVNTDDEGNPTEKTVLVENGVLKNYIHDEISAEHYGVAPTGSGRRESFRHAPMPRMRATYMESGPHDPERCSVRPKKAFTVPPLPTARFKSARVISRFICVRAISLRTESLPSRSKTSTS